MNNIIFERPIASRFEYNNKTNQVNTNNQFSYLTETSNIHTQFHYSNNVNEQHNTYGMLKPVSTRDEKKVSEEKKKFDYGKKSNATIYNK